MGVHVLATNLASVGTGFEPQRAHNFAVEFSGIPGPGDSDLLTLSIETATLPRCTNEPVTLPYGNEEVFVAGRARWEQGSMTLRDWIDRPVAQTLLNWRNIVYNPFTGSIGLATNYKKQASIVLFGPNSQEGTPTYERVWKLVGVWPMDVSLASLDMSRNDIVHITVVLRYDKAFP